MTPDSFQALLRQEVDDASAYFEEELKEFRIKALDYYHGEPFGNEKEGSSRAVLTEVADTIDFMMPSLMRIFTATDDYGKFVPRGPEDVAGARQATDYFNYVTNGVNNGFILLHDWFKDALLFKMGVIKSCWDEKIDVTEETYIGLSDAEFEALQADPDIEVIEHEAESRPELLPDGQIGEIAIHGVRVRKKETSGRIVHKNVPPEEFLLERQARGPIQELRFCAHQTRLMVSDLVAMGYDRDEVLEYAGDEEDDNQEELQARFTDLDGGLVYDEGRGVTRKVLVTEAYIRADYDDDGIAELRKVLAIGETLHILENEPWEKIPFAVISPVLMPHRLIGRSIAELVMDIQLIKSTILRQQLDNLYRSNNATMAAVEGQVNLDDLLNPVPGGVIRIRQQGAVTPLSAPDMIGSSFPMLEYLDATKEQRTGITKASAGLDADALQSTTAAAVNATIRAAEGKLEMIARVFAETGGRDLMFNTLWLAQKHVTEPEMIRLRGEFVPVDPRSWANHYDYIANVGLGSGQTQEKIATLMQIAAKQEMILQLVGPKNPLVSLEQYAATLSRTIEAAGFKDTETFFNRPETVAKIVQAEAQRPPQPPPPDPKLMAEMQKAQAEIALKREQVAAEIALKREEMQQKMQLRREEMAMEQQLRAAEIAAGGSASTNLPRAQ